MIKQKEITVCITGASRGLGFAMVKAFSNTPGVSVAAVTGSGEMLRNKLSESKDSSHVEIIAANLTEASGRKTIRKHLEKMPPLKVVIHNAGKLTFKPFAEITQKELEEIYSVNVFAPFLLTQELLPIMESTHTLTISSIGGMEGTLKFGGLSAYSSSKAALICLTEMLSEEFKDTSNVFNCLALGSVETEMFKTAFPGVSASSSPEDMAAFIQKFAFDAPKVMRGKIIPISLSNP